MLKQTTIKINGKDAVLKKAYKALILFEELTGVDAYKANNSIKHSLSMFYAVLKANNDFITMTFDEFLTYLDDHPEDSLYNKYMEWSISLLQPEKAVQDKKKVEKR